MFFDNFKLIAALLLVIFAPKSDAFTQLQNCAAFCVVAAQCNNQCDNTAIGVYSQCVCQASCLCVMEICNSCCAVSLYEPLCVSGSSYNLNFCQDFDNGAAPDTRCYPYIDNSFPYGPNFSFPASIQDFMHTIPNPTGGIHLGPNDTLVANKTATFSTSFTSPASRPPPTPIGFYPANVTNAILRPETTATTTSAPASTDTGSTQPVTSFTNVFGSTATTTSVMQSSSSATSTPSGKSGTSKLRTSGWSLLVSLLLAVLIS